MIFAISSSHWQQRTVRKGVMHVSEDPKARESFNVKTQGRHRSSSDVYNGRIDNPQRGRQMNHKVLLIFTEESPFLAAEENSWVSGDRLLVSLGRRGS